MRARRGLENDRLLCAGPGRLCQALGITREHDGLPLDRRRSSSAPREPEPELVVGPRIGITKATDKPWRYGLSGLALTSAAHSARTDMSRGQTSATSVCPDRDDFRIFPARRRRSFPSHWSDQRNGTVTTS